MQVAQGVHGASAQRQKRGLRAQREHRALDRGHQGTERHYPPPHAAVVRTVFRLSDGEAVLQQGVEDAADACAGCGKTGAYAYLYT